MKICARWLTMQGMATRPCRPTCSSGRNDSTVMAMGRVFSLVHTHTAMCSGQFRRTFGTRRRSHSAVPLKVRLNWPEHMAVWVCTSEKTLPIAITVLSFLPEEQVGRHGLVAIPCIVSHLAQIF